MAEEIAFRCRFARRGPAIPACGGAFLSAQKLRQLGDVRRDPPRLIAIVGRGAGPWLLAARFALGL
jgi:hypothetical protein